MGGGCRGLCWVWEVERGEVRCICPVLAAGAGFRRWYLVVRLEALVAEVVVSRACRRFCRFVPWEAVLVQCTSPVIVLLWTCWVRLGSGKSKYIERKAAAATVSKLMETLLMHIPTHATLPCHSVRLGHSAADEQPPEAGS